MAKCVRLSVWSSSASRLRFGERNGVAGRVSMLADCGANQETAMVKVLAGKRNQEDLTSTGDKKCEWSKLMKCAEVTERPGVRRRGSGVFQSVGRSRKVLRSIQIVEGVGVAEDVW